MTTIRDLRLKYKSDTGIEPTITYSIAPCEGTKDKPCDAIIESSESGFYPDYEFDCYSNEYVEYIENKLIESLKINEKHPLLTIANAAMNMDWQIAVEKDQETVRGVSVGTEEYMQKLFNK